MSAETLPRQPDCTVWRITPEKNATRGIQFEILRRKRSSKMAAQPTLPAIQICAVMPAPLCPIDRPG